MLQCERVVALGTLADVLHIRLCAGPPDAVHLVARITGGDRLFQCGRIHDAPAPKQHVVGAALPNLQPGGLLLDTGRGNRQQTELEAMHGGAFLQQRNRLLAITAVVVHQRDLLALELVESALLLAEVLDQDVRGNPVVAGDREIPLVDQAILRCADAITGGQQRNLVAGRLLRQRLGDTGRQGLENGGATILAFEPFVTLDAAISCVAGFTFLEQCLDSVDSAFGVDQFHVVGHAVGERHAVGRERTRPVHQRWEKLLLGLRKGGGTDRGQQGSQSEFSNLH